MRILRKTGMKYQGIVWIAVLNKSILVILFLTVSLAYIQSAAGGSIESAQKLAYQLHSSNESTPVTDAPDPSVPVKSTNSGVVQIPMRQSSSVYTTDKEQNIKTDEEIGIERRRTVTNTDSGPSLKACSQSGPIPIMVVGDNPSIVASSRLKVSNDWGRYQMDSMPFNTKGSSSVLANGIMVSIRMAL